MRTFFVSNVACIVKSARRLPNHYICCSLTKQCWRRCLPCIKAAWLSNMGEDRAQQFQGCAETRICRTFGILTDRWPAAQMLLCRCNGNTIECCTLRLKQRRHHLGDAGQQCMGLNCSSFVLQTRHLRDYGPLLWSLYFDNCIGNVFAGFRSQTNNLAWK